MTDEQINIAIIEVIRTIQPWRFPKDYVNDLNAMHEAEETIRHDKWKWLAFCNHLDDMCNDQWNTGSIRATARQRAEAFLRTLGKWEEVQP
jgi:hypothetical protein